MAVDVARRFRLDPRHVFRDWTFDELAATMEALTELHERDKGEGRERRPKRGVWQIETPDEQRQALADLRAEDRRVRRARLAKRAAERAGRGAS